MPFEEAVDRDDAAPPRIGVSKRRQRRDRFGFGIDGLAAAGRIPAAMRDNPQRKRSRERSPVWWFSRMTSSSWLGAPLNRGFSLENRESTASRPSTMASRNGPLD